MPPLILQLLSTIPHGVQHDHALPRHQARIHQSSYEIDEKHFGRNES